MDVEVYVQPAGAVSLRTDGEVTFIQPWSWWSHEIPSYRDLGLSNQDFTLRESEGCNDLNGLPVLIPKLLGCDRQAIGQDRPLVASYRELELNNAASLTAQIQYLRCDCECIVRS